MLRSEAGLARRLIDRGGHGLLDRGGRRQILDAPTVRAHQVVVVPGEIFGKLVARKVVARHHAMNDAGFFEHDEVAIHRALREPVACGEDLGNRHRS